MKEKLKKYLSKKEVIVILVLLIITLSALSYAFFISYDITGSNIARTECFKLTLQGNNDISLQDAYPMSESEGSQLTPYTFTIKNVCNMSADYQVNLETLSTSTLDTEYVRVKLNDNESMILKRNELNTTNVNDNVKEGRKITTGTLRSNEEITYNLRLWIDEASTKEQSANKIYTAKVSVMATPNVEAHDVTIAYIVDGVAQENPPAKGTGYGIKNIDCTNATGTWNNAAWSLTLSNWSGKVTCDLEFETVTSISITMHGAPGAVIEYDDANGSHSQTLDSTGKKENVSISVMDNISFTDTTVSKDPDNLSNNFTKSINITSETEDLYIMPDNALYWYGYFIENFTSTGMRDSGYTGTTSTAPTVTYNANSVHLQINYGTFKIGTWFSDNVQNTSQYPTINIVASDYETPVNVSPGIIFGATQSKENGYSWDGTNNALGYTAFSPVTKLSVNTGVTTNDYIAVRVRSGQNPNGAITIYAIYLS